MSEEKNPFAGLDGPSVQGEGRKLPVAKPVPKPMKKPVVDDPPNITRTRWRNVKYYAIFATVLMLIGGYGVWDSKPTKRAVVAESEAGPVRDKLEIETDQAKGLIGKSYSDAKAVFGSPDKVMGGLSFEEWTYLNPNIEGTYFDRRTANTIVTFHNNEVTRVIMYRQGKQILFAKPESKPASKP